MYRSSSPKETVKKKKKSSYQLGQTMKKGCITASIHQEFLPLPFSI
jgi:hypothetical protein